MSQVSQPYSALEQFRQGLTAFWQFSRPHTIIGTSLSVWALYAIALSQTPTASFGDSWGQLLGSWMACLCGNVYIVGLNQLEDVDIDRINKPQLPLASGDFSRMTGARIVAVTGLLAIILAWGLGYSLLVTVGLSLVIGTAYSLPPIRLKRFPLWASFCIFTVRGIIVNVGLYWHFSRVLSPSGVFPPELWALTGFILGFTFAIALFKDMPDIEGDARYNISTFTLRLGTQTVFRLGLGAIAGCYLGMMVAGFVWLSGVNALGLAVSQLAALGLLLWQSQKVDLQDKISITSFYQFVWKLFFLEYLMFPAACWLG